MPHQSKRPFKRSFNLGIIQAAVLAEIGLTIEEARQSLKASRRVANQVFVESVRQNFLWEKMRFSATKGTGCVGVTLRKTKGALLRLRVRRTPERSVSDPAAVRGNRNIPTPGESHFAGHPHYA